MIDAVEVISRQKYGFSRMVPLSYTQAVEKTKQALKDQGFGVLAEIDVRKAMKEKLGVDFPDYVILGACNPPLAHRALTAEPLLGLLLPCNVIVRAVEDGTEVGVIDADAMLSVVGNAELQPIAREANERLQKALRAL